MSSYNVNSPHTRITAALNDVNVKYHIHKKKIGHGAHGVVCRCQNRRTGKWFAIKSIVKKKFIDPVEWKREIDILKKVSHPNIIKLEEAYFEKTHIHIITELCTGGELFDRIIERKKSGKRPFNENDAAMLIQSILSAIKHCHDQGIIHRDLKLDNLMYLTSERCSPIKIIDFGSSCETKDLCGVHECRVGTAYYVAPETLNGKFTKGCDMWSIGIITYLLLCGYPPFLGDSDIDILMAIRKGKYEFPSPDFDNISTDAKGFISNLLQMSSTLRLTSDQALKHPWIINNTKNIDSIPVTRSIKLIPETKSIKSTPDANVENIILNPEPTYLNPCTKPIKIPESKPTANSEKFDAFQRERVLKKKFRRGVLKTISEKMKVSEIEALKKTFCEIDRDKDGKLTMEEIDSALNNGAFNGDFLKEMKLLRQELKVLGKDSLDWKDFFPIVIDEEFIYNRGSIIFGAFENLRGSKLFLTESNIQNLVGETTCSLLMDQIDVNNDGEVDLDEFEQFFITS